MGRRRRFDETKVLDVVVECFWLTGYEGTSIKDVSEETGLTVASLYNAYGDKRALFHKALDRYIESRPMAGIQHSTKLPGRAALQAFFDDVVRDRLQDQDEKGCMFVNAAIEVALHDPDVRHTVTTTLLRFEEFFLSCAQRGQEDGTISRARTAETHARNLLTVLIGQSVLARVHPEPVLLREPIELALAELDRP